MERLNPFGIGVVNFDFYGVAGLGMLSTEALLCQV